jgi:hypothetical protein
VLLLLAGCGGDDGDGDHVPKDDFLVSFPSPLEIFIRRPLDRPFEVLEIGVSPFIDPVFGPEAYELVVSGIAFLDGAEIVFEAEDVASIAFIDPLGERVIDVLIACDCFLVQRGAHCRTLIDSRHPQLGEPKYTTVHEFRAPEVAESPEWEAVRNARTPVWSEKISPQMTFAPGSPGVYTRIF